MRSLTLIEPVLPTLLAENAADRRLHQRFAQQKTRGAHHHRSQRMHQAICRIDGAAVGILVGRYLKSLIGWQRWR